MTKLANIPYTTKREDTQVLLDCINRAAEMVGMHGHQAALLMTYFLQYVAEAVARNKAVNIPCFGLFAPRKVVPKQKGRLPYSAPGFYPSCGFRNEVSLTCPPDEAYLSATLDYRRNASRRAGHRKRVFTGMKVFRETIRKEARASGVEL